MKEGAGVQWARGRAPSLWQQRAQPQLPPTRRAQSGGGGRPGANTEAKELWPTWKSGVGLQILWRRYQWNIPGDTAPPPRTGGKTTGRWAGSPAALTKVIVVHHRVGRPHPGPLLGEVVAEFEKRCVLFQHAHNLHFHFVAQRLALWWRKEQHSPLIPSVQELIFSTRRKPARWAGILATPPSPRTGIWKFGEGEGSHSQAWMIWDSNPGSARRQEQIFPRKLERDVSSNEQVSRKWKILLPRLYSILMKSESPGTRLRCLWCFQTPRWCQYTARFGNQSLRRIPSIYKWRSRGPKMEKDLPEVTQ